MTIFCFQVKHSQRKNLVITLSPRYLHGSLWKNLEIFWPQITVVWQDWVKDALILVQSYSTLNMELEFAIQKLAQRGKHFGFCVEVCDIDFSAAKTLKKNLDAKVVNYADTENAPVTRKSCSQKYATPTSNELNSFFNKLGKCGAKPLILYIAPGYCNEYTPHDKDISKFTIRFMTLN